MKLHLQNLSSLITGSAYCTLLTLLFLFSASQINAQGTWTPVTTVAPNLNGGVMILLSDGTVMCKTTPGVTGQYGNLWNKLTPDINGSYVNGTWSTLAPMANTRLYFSSQVLKDGRVYVAGGEYGTGGAAGEVYNPLTNTWTNTPAPGFTVSDANSEMMPDGRILQAIVDVNASPFLRVTKIYNPATNTYINGPTCLGIHNESAWVKLPDNSVLFVDRLSTASERYIPASNTWINDATVPVALYDPFGDETGGALLLPDGRAWFIGALGHTAYYTPSGSTAMGSWAAGPDVPLAKGTPDAPCAMMVNGKILCSVSPIPTSATHFPTPTTFYEFDYLTNTFTSILAPGGAASLNISCYTTNFLDLPDGTVLYSRQGSTQYYVYTPSGSPLAAGKPAISNITPINCTTYSITGTQFNGISQGANYGDDWQMSSNYPLVRLTSGANVYYTRTSNWNSNGVKRGSLPDTAQFVLPAGLPTGTYNLVVVANGIASNPVSFTTGLSPTISGSFAFCAGSSSTLNAGAGYSIYNWSTGATTQTININAAGVYTVTVTNATGCTGSASASTTVSASPTPSISGNTSICAGSSTTLNAGAGYSAYNWSSGATTQTINVNTANIFTVTVTGANGCTGSTSATTTVNANPSPSITGNLIFCAGSSTTLDAGNGYSGYNWSSGATTQTIVSSTVATYTVNVTNAAGCSGSTSVNTIVNPLPTVSFSGLSASYTVSAGAAALTGSPAGGTFSGPGVSGNTFTPANAGVGGPYTITYSYTDGNGCSNSASQQTTVTNCTPPVKPGAITTVGGVAKVCPGDSKTYTIPAVAGATSYLWIPPVGGAVSGGQGTTSATISYNSGFVVADSLKVAAVNACGTGVYRALKINRNAKPAQPGVISGTQFGVCNGTGIPYSVTNVAGVNYNWTNTSINSTIATGQGTSSITANFNAGYVKDTLKVTAGNTCGTSLSRTLIIKAIPATPAAIAGAATVCANQTGVPYSTAALFGATNYTWMGPTGSHVSDGVNTSAGTTLTTTATNVTVNFGTTAGSVKVKGNNSCGSGVYFSKSVAFNCRNGNDLLTDDNNFNIYPNPNDGKFSIQFVSVNDEKANLSLVNALGQTLYNEVWDLSMGENVKAFNIADNVPAGIYFIVIKTELGSYRQKVVKQ
ncbi:MAG: T9SS type A sorting domain-containing protein [Bacteroidia bacterium]